MKTEWDLENLFRVRMSSHLRYRESSAIGFVKLSVIDRTGMLTRGRVFSTECSVVIANRLHGLSITRTGVENDEESGLPEGTRTDYQ